VIKHFTRTTLAPALGYALFVAITLVMLDAATVKLFGHFRGFSLAAGGIAGVATFLCAYFNAWQQRHTVARIDAYKSYNYYQQMKINRSLQVLLHVYESCNHIGDPAHENCRAVWRREFRAIQAAMGNSPDPMLVFGNKPLATGTER
jgi:hypothetical protein